MSRIRINTVAALLFASLAVSGCSGDGASKSHFMSLIAAAAKKPSNANAVTLRVILPNVRATPHGMKLLVDSPAFGYAILQTLVDAGVLRRTHYEDGAVYYDYADAQRAKRIFFVKAPMVAVNLGRLKPEGITNFTKPGNDVSNPDSTATVMFKPAYSDWLDDKKLTLIRQWYGITYSQRYDGDNPALSDDETNERMLSGSALDSLRNAADSGQDVDVQRAMRALTSIAWAPLSLKSVTQKVRLHRSDDGWKVAEPASEWSPITGQHLAPLSKQDLDKAADRIADTLNAGRKKPAPITKMQIDKAMKRNASLAITTFAPFQVSRQMPALGLMPETCNAKASRGWTQINIQYSCNAQDAKQLDILAANGLAKRDVPAPGVVRYTPTDKIKPLIQNDQLIIGWQRIVAVNDQKPGVTWYGQPKILANVEARTHRAPWSKDPVFEDLSPTADGQRHHYLLDLVEGQKGQWQVDSYSEISQ